jgi:3-phenylpropionate/cinnamic acid dioxygenase small subunit
MTTDDAGTQDSRIHGEVAQVLVRYASGIDGRDWALLRSCFTDDCDVDYGDIGAWHGADEITEWMRVTHEPCGHTLHRITNVVVEPDGPERARARAYVDAVIMVSADGGAHAMGFYDDELVRTADGWQIARRRYTTVHIGTIGTGVGF